MVVLQQVHAAAAARVRALRVVALQDVLPQLLGNVAVLAVQLARGALRRALAAVAQEHEPALLLDHIRALLGRQRLHGPPEGGAYCSVARPRDGRCADGTLGGRDGTDSMLRSTCARHLSQRRVGTLRQGLLLLLCGSLVVPIPHGLLAGKALIFRLLHVGLEIAL